MKFYSEKNIVPKELVEDNFVLRQLRTKDAQMDYDAVIKSRDNLLLKTFGDWPPNSFKVDDNINEIQVHEEDYHNRENFTFTILNPHQTQCLGCVYIGPYSYFYELSNEARSQKVDCTGIAAVNYWTVEKLNELNFSQNFINKIYRWLSTEWHFRKVLFVANCFETKSMLIYKNAGLIKFCDLQFSCILPFAASSKWRPHIEENRNVDVKNYSYSFFGPK